MKFFKRFLVELKRLEDNMKFSNIFPGYVFNKNVFRFFSLVLILLGLLSLSIDGFSSEYIVCHSIGYDHNFQVLCEYPGQVFGDVPSFLTLNFGNIAFLLVGISFLFNHLIFNWRRNI